MVCMGFFANGARSTTVPSTGRQMTHSHTLGSFSVAWASSQMTPNEQAHTHTHTHTHLTDGSVNSFVAPCSVICMGFFANGARHNALKKATDKPSKQTHTYTNTPSPTSQPTRPLQRDLHGLLRKHTMSSRKRQTNQTHAHTHTHTHTHTTHIHTKTHSPPTDQSTRSSPLAA